MAIRFFQPREDLRDFVVRIYAHESLESEILDPRWLIVPDGDIKIIFPFRGDIRCAIGEAERLHRASRIIVSGMRTEPGYLGFPEGVDAIGVVLRPEAAYRFLGVPMHELRNRTLEGEELFGGTARRWQEAATNLTRVEDRVECIQRGLRALLDRRESGDPALEHAVRRLRSHDGRVRIDDLARELGWSRRQLDRKFQERVGVGPKSLASVLRFHAVYKALRNTTVGSRYDRLIYDHYYDQAHFLKDFKRYAGSAPRGFLQASDYGRYYIPGEERGPGHR